MAFYLAFYPASILTLFLTFWPSLWPSFWEIVQLGSIPKVTPSWHKEKAERRRK
jgi:hypothetical protein